MIIPETGWTLVSQNQGDAGWNSPQKDAEHIVVMEYMHEAYAVFPSDSVSWRIAQRDLRLIFSPKSHRKGNTFPESNSVAIDET